MSRRIHVRVFPTGEIQVEAEGFKGSGCEAATKAIEEVLGRPIGRTRKSDFYRQTQRQQGRQQIGEGA